jgi:hypothetical protein
VVSPNQRKGKEVILHWLHIILQWAKDSISKEGQRDLKVKVKVEERVTVYMDLPSCLLPSMPCVGREDLELRGQTGSSPLWGGMMGKKKLQIPHAAHQNVMDF